MTKKHSSEPASEDARREDYLRALAALSRVASESLPPQRLLQHAAARISAVEHIRHVKVLRYRAETGDLLMVAGVGWKPGVVGQAVLTSDSASPAGRSIQTGLPVVIGNIADDPEYRFPAVLREHGIVSLVNVPVMIDGLSWGVLEIDSDQPRSFDEGDIGFLSTCANVLALALKSRRAEQHAAAIEEQHDRDKERSQTLIREMRHRVKNNFQTIIGFLALQRKQADKQNARECFAAAMDRVHAIALVHDQLSVRAEESDVDFADYLRALCRNITRGADRIAVNVEAQEGMLPLDRAVPAGLIVNELVTNALKHAFAGGEGTVRVVFKTEPDMGTAYVTVSDDGKGMGPRREGGLGLDLIAALAQQLSGRIEQEQPGPGTHIRISFPLPM